jgi:regulator of replication initiation timing
MKELEGADRIANNFAQTACLRGDEIERLRLENEKLAAAMSSDGADACGALVVAEAEIERLRTQVADQAKDIACDEQRIADLMSDVQRQGLEIERLRHLAEHYETEWGKCSTYANKEIERLRGLVGIESPDLDLDWNRLRSGDNRALISDHQDVFDMVAGMRAEIERLRQQVTQRGARMQVMREAWRQTDWMQWISYDYPEAREWFDDDGVPR